jgi:hypothetical protein
LTDFKGSLSHGGTLRRVGLSIFFLKPSQAASKSVASISATAWGHRVARSIKGARSWSLIWRRPPTPNRARNWLTMRTSGIRSRWDKRAKERQARCSANSVNTWLTEWAGVSTVNKFVRHNWALLKYGRGPRGGRTFQCPLIKSSGMKGSTNANSSAVPVIGKLDLLIPKATPFKPLRPHPPQNHKFWTQEIDHENLMRKLVTPSKQGELR